MQRMKQGLEREKRVGVRGWNLDRCSEAVVGGTGYFSEGGSKKKGRNSKQAVRCGRVPFRDGEESVYCLRCVSCMLLSFSIISMATTLDVCSKEVLCSRGAKAG